jgi:AraC-like DNA-binding protein/tetratricopeptide (TPR) repeat protein
MLSSCQQPTSPDLPQESPIPNDLQQKLAQAKKSNVDSAIYYSDVILAYIRENALPDSLHIAYGSIKSDYLLKTGDQYKALQLLIENYYLAHNLGDSLLIAKTAGDLGNCYSTTFYNSLALPYLEEAATYYKKNSDQLKAAKTFSNLGGIYLESGEFYKALEYYNLVADFYSAHSDTINLAYAFADIGYTLKKLGLSEAALDITRKGIQLVESLPNGDDVGLTFNNLAINYRSIYPDSAIFYQRKAIELTAALGDSLNWIAGIYNLGNSLKDVGQFEVAEKTYKQVYDFCLKNDLEQGIVLSYNALGDLYLQSGKPGKAIQYASLADAEFKKMGSTLNVIDNLKTLISAYTQVGNQLQRQKLQNELDSLDNQMEISITQNRIQYIEQALKAERTAFDNQLLQQKNTAIATAVQWRTYSIFFLVLAMAISAVLWLRWKSDNQSAQQVIQVLLQRYAKEIQQKKLRGQSLAADSSYSSQLAQKLRYLLETEKIYLQPNLKTEDVLKYLQISYKDLNQLLKSEFQATFPQLINQYRISTAQQLLSNPQNQDLSMDEIATLSGFGSRQSFYRTFHTNTGVNPGAFKTFLLSKG